MTSQRVKPLLLVHCAQFSDASIKDGNTGVLTRDPPMAVKF